MSLFEGPPSRASCGSSALLDSSTPWLQDAFFVNMISPDKILPLAMAASHPSLLHLANLVLRAVLEVVCVSLPGYILARQGMFDVDHQKFAANLNIMLFTPCLIFSKIASQLSPEKFPELAIIPVIFLIQTLVSYIVATSISKLFGFKKRPRYFVTAMAVFGNSNSLPISLVISLSRTIPSLRWNKVPNDNSDEVAARGILYLMIFQQLGQIVRWSWGYRQLLAKPEKFTAEEGGNAAARIEAADDEDSASERDSLLLEPEEQSYSTLNPSSASSQARLALPKDDAIHSSSSSATLDELHHRYLTRKSSDYKALQRPKINVLGPNGTMNSFADDDHVKWSSPASWIRGLGRATSSLLHTIKRYIAQLSFRVFLALPPTVQSFLKKTGNITSRFFNALWELMNAPLWAMIAAVVVACSPQLRHYFFTKGTFVNTSVTRAVEQTGQVAIPLILLVLGANLANNTKPVDNDLDDNEEPKLERKLVIVSLLCRMLLPTLIMAPILALFAKYVPVSILDDPVFVVVAFLLTGAPSALQLAQICQINDVYIGAMTSILFQSYVIWILPSTLALVMIALEVVKWAAVK